MTEQDLKATPVYTTLLAANAKGCAFLKEWRKESKDDPDGLLIVTKPADAPEGRQKELSGQADALFTLCYPSPKTAGELMRKSPIILP